MRVKNKLTSLLLLGMVAMPAFSQARLSSQQQIASHSRLARQYLIGHQPKLAIPEFQAIIALDPKNVDARGNLGVLYFFQGDYAKAVPQLQAALKLKAGLWKIQSLLGLSERRLGDDGVGRADLEAAFPHLEEAALKIQVGRDLIDSYSSTGDLDRAASIASSLLKIQPTDPSLLYTAYRLYSDLAGEAMLDLSLAAPESGQMHQAMAHELARERDIPGAIANFRKAVAINPNLPGIHFELAEALRASSDLKLRAEAEQEYKLAVAANGRDTKSLTKLGDIAVEKDDFDGAVAYYKRALALMPGDADATLGLAHVYIEKDESASALPLLERLVAADPTNVVAHYRLSTAYRKLKRPDDAKRELEAYQKYKDIKEKMRAVYKEMRLDTPQDEPDK